TDLGTQPVFRRIMAKLMPLLRGPTLRQIAGAIESTAIVKQPDPKRRQRAEPPPRPTIGPSHLEEPLKPRLREDRGQMIGPVRQRRFLTRQCRQPAVEKIAEALPQRVDIF